MELTLLNQSAAFVDRNRQRRYSGCIFVIRADEVLLVKCLVKDSDRSWQLTSDNSEWRDTLLPNDAKIVSEVKWLGRTFV